MDCTKRALDPNPGCLEYTYFFHRAPQGFPELDFATINRSHGFSFIDTYSLLLPQGCSSCSMAFRFPRTVFRRSD